MTVQDNEATNNIAANVSRLLEERGMSQRALARAANEPVMNISRLVHGKNEPGIGILTRIAEVLETTVDALLAPTGKSISRKNRRTA